MEARRDGSRSAHRRRRYPRTDGIAAKTHDARRKAVKTACNGRLPYYKTRERSVIVDDVLAQRVKHMIDAEPYLGYRMVWARLRMQGIVVNRKAVQRIMQVKGWQCHRRLKKRCSPRVESSVSVVQFSNVRWATDATYIWTRYDGLIYLNAILDCADRGCIGFNVSQRNDAMGTPSFGSGALQTEVILLHAAVPGAGGGASTSPSEIAQSVNQSLSQMAPDLRITVHPNSTKLILVGSPRSLEMARRLIAQLDVAEPLVELDTEVLEVDEGVQKQLGFKFPTPVLSTTYSELQPESTGGISNQLLRLQPLTRTPLTLGGELDFLISTNKARILEDPRITTFSGRTASLHAGETVNILTTTGGGTGTVATTQVQSFQTGVTLDITPVVNTDDYVTVTLHPSINSEAGISSAGVPNIQTRDTTTTVGLRAGETIVIGGLIEDDSSRTVTKVPILGDLPLIGRLFQDVGVNHTRNELIVTVTPHIVHVGAAPYRDLGTTLTPPSPEPLPTVGVSATLPPLSTRPHTLSSITAETSQPTPYPLSIPSDATAVSQNSPFLNSSPSPGPLPSAFAQTNTYTFGSAPQNNYADPNQPPQIFFVQVQPTVVKAGQSVTLSAITSTNVSSLSFGPSTTSALVTLSSISPGKWLSTITFSLSGLASNSGNVSEILTARTGLGASTSVKLPFSIISE